ncbi:MAG: ISAs1 family transposase, partial [Planctomycetaceae bacterium]|nr:ISAs1 family transposase [Planctomycetaceae bacterium]
MSDVRRIHLTLDEVVRHFEELEDPRCSITRTPPLVSVVVLAVIAVLAGASGPTAIARWAALKEEFLITALDLPDGVPGKDVFRRVLVALRPEAFRACFVNWLESLRAEAAAATGVEQPILAVDGKTARRSHDRKNGLGALHSVTVWASEFGLSLGQVACAAKSNEITAIPEVLRLVDIKGAIITIDAMGAQKAIAAQIIDGEGDYVLALKGNQEALHQAVIDYIGEQLEGELEGAQEHVTVETGHGREETRTYLQLPAPEGLPGFGLWKALRTIAVVTSLCIRDGKQAAEVRYYISSLAMDVKRLARAVRGHWGVENGCHWILDVTYREDESRIREEALQENFAWLNRFTLSLLKQHPDRTSIAMKRRSCGWNDDYLMQVLTGST